MSESNSAAPPAVLIVDKHSGRLDALAGALRRLDYQVLITPDGPTAIFLIAVRLPDLVILNTLLPGVSAVEVCRTIRREHTMPILMLSDHRGRLDPAWDYPLGTNDIMVRPFNLDELLGRVQSILRTHGPPAGSRSAPPDDLAAADRLPAHPGAPAHPPFRLARFTLDPDLALPVLRRGDLEIDLAARAGDRTGQAIQLKPQEFDLLAFLAQHPGCVFSRTLLLQRVWSHHQDGNPRTVDVHVRWLRTKLERVPSDPQIIQTVHRVGYRFNAAVEVQSAAG